MEQCYILRYGEIATRGQNRIMYEDFLETNVRKMLSEHKIKAKIKRYKGRMIVITNENASFLKMVFGLVSISNALRTKKNAKEINDALNKFDNPLPIIKFADKGKEDKMLAESINKGDNGKAFVEIYPDNAFVYNKKEKAAGGLPIGSEGKVIVEIEDERGILSALLMMKRGCEAIPLLKKKLDISLLKEFGCYNNSIQKIEDAKDVLAIVTEKKDKYNLPKLNPLTGVDAKKSLESFNMLRQTSQ